MSIKSISVVDDPYRLGLGKTYFSESEMVLRAVWQDGIFDEQKGFLVTPYTLVSVLEIKEFLNGTWYKFGTFDLQSQVKIKGWTAASELDQVSEVCFTEM